MFARILGIQPLFWFSGRIDYIPLNLCIESFKPNWYAARELKTILPLGLGFPLAWDNNSMRATPFPVQLNCRKGTPDAYHDKLCLRTYASPMVRHSLHGF